MSTPIQQGELSPDDPKFYAPPKWRSSEIDAPSIQPSLRATEFPVSQPSADWTSHDDNVLLVEAVPESREHPDKLEHSRMRVTALAIAVGVVVWTAFCIAVGLGRLDTTALAQMRNGLLFANDPEISVSERLQSANTALQRVSRQVLAPTLVVADASGDVNAALPLTIKVTNYTPDISINLSGLVVGTMLSSGSSAGEGQWRIAIDDLPNTRVIPPPGYVGPMTVIAELRSGDDQAIVRTPVQLIWRPGATNSTEAAGPQPSAAPPPDDAIATEQAVDEQLVARQKDLRSHSRRHGSKRGDIVLTLRGQAVSRIRVLRISVGTEFRYRTPSCRPTLILAGNDAQHWPTIYMPMLIAPENEGRYGTMISGPSLIAAGNGVRGGPTAVGKRDAEKMR